MLPKKLEAATALTTLGNKPFIVVTAQSKGSGRMDATT
jgi:hypothetical protein